MMRLRGLVAAAGVACGLMAAAAEALPPVMDRIPADALVVIATPSLDRLDKSARALNGLVNAPTPIPGMKEALRMGGMEEGVDLTKSAAAVIMPGDLDADVPPLVVLVPTTDYAALLGNFDVKPAPGVVEAEIDGEPAFFRDLGNGYAVMSPLRELAEQFTGKGGNTAAHEQALGPSNRQIADSADLVVIANIQGLRPLVEPKIKDKFEEMAANSPLAMMGGGAPDTAQAEAIVTAFIQQTRSAVAGVRVDGTGVAIDAGAQFLEGTFLANTFAQGGSAGPLLDRLPALPTGFFLAGAVDLSTPGMKQLVKKVSEAQKEQAAAAGGPDMNFMLRQMENTDGYSMVLGASPGAIFGAGLLVNTVAYVKTPDPAKYIQDMKAGMEAMKEQAEEGVTFETAYTEGAATINGVSVDSWEMRLNMADADPQMMMGMQTFFGPAGGPQGYVAKSNGGIVQTYSKNSVLMGEALKAAQGANAGLGGDQLLKQVQAKLPEGRLAEGYIGMKSIMDLVKTFLAMNGTELDVPEQLPPVGMALGGSGGAGRVGIFVPGPVIKTVSDAVKSVQQGDDGFGDEDPAGGTGQPRF